MALFGLGGNGLGGGGRRGIDSEVLAELRAIREEIHSLSERVAQSATREDLDDYVTKAEFNAYTGARQRWADLWRQWFPNVVALVALLYAVFGPRLH